MEVDTTKRIKRGRPTADRKRDSLGACLPVTRALLNITGWTFNDLKYQVCGWERKKIRAAAIYAMVLNGASIKGVTDALEVSRSTVRYAVVKAETIYKDDKHFCDLCERLLAKR